MLIVTQISLFVNCDVYIPNLKNGVLTSRSRIKLKNRTTIETKVGKLTGEPGQILVTYPCGVSIVCTRSAFLQLFEPVGKIETSDEEPTSFQKAMEDIREVKDG